MSNLTPQKRPDRNGKMVTRHVKTSNDSTTKRFPLPLAPAAMNQNDLHTEDIIRESLYRHMGEDGAEDYLSFVIRKPQVIQTALAKALVSAADREQTNAALAIFEESTDNTQIVLALDDLDFMTSIARSPHGVVDPYAGSTKAYYGAIMVMTQAFTEHFQRDALSPETVDIDTYGPFLRAATLTKALGLDNHAPTSLDSHRQLEHVVENLSAFKRHYPVLIRVAQEARPLNSHALLEVCRILDDQPEATDPLIAYLNERRRFEMDEFKEILAAASRPLSSGTL